ncbi:beta-ketoacyl synthase N-terminal-like domain-containing protein [Saccharibacillus sacchari]|uniref:Beta-ketoacyl synthase N-terminal-like domain-containing protein n=1 Tax=Saccharibacillus sacchari TaxID=456493 RepID=A0ACC6PJD4_9BACL
MVKEAVDKRLLKQRIAIVGLACKFPAAKNKKEYWNNLIQGKNSIKVIPEDRWRLEEFHSADVNFPEEKISNWAGVVDNVFDFDNSFFHVSPREAKSMDPQQRLLLEETWSCIEDSGIPLKELQDKKTAVYIGAMTTDYRYEAIHEAETIDSYSCLGHFEALLANRISYNFNFCGTSQTLNAACASSLVAIHEAKRSLLAEDCDYAVAGGVNLNLHPSKYIAFSKSHMLSPDGQCKTFDADANGYVPGDGVGVVLLQRLDRALENGNHIYGLIDGSAINHGGKALSITAPQIKAQRDVIESAIKDANIDPETITYVEAHGTGTSLGDPIEIEALTQAFQSFTNKNNFCAIGSVKTNIGHLEAAAGIAGVIKVLMMMQYKKIPSHLNFKKLNPMIHLENSPFFITPTKVDWGGESNGAEQPLRAGVSSFGFGGVNAHVIMESYPPHTVGSQDEEWTGLFVLSAKTKRALEELILEWRDFIKTDYYATLSLRDVCSTLSHGREAMSWRCGVYVKSKKDIETFLSSYSLFESSHDKDPYILLLGNLSYEGYNDELKAYVHSFPGLSQNLAALFNQANEVLNIKTIKMNFFRPKWPIKYMNLYRFILSVAIGKFLIKMGLPVYCTASVKEGIWPALVLSEKVSFEEAVKIIQSQKSIDSIEFRKSHLFFYDAVKKQFRKPYVIDKEYINLMSNNSSPEFQIWEECVYLAKRLLKNQHTFRKLMEDWSRIIKQATKLNIIEVLDKDENILASETYGYGKSLGRLLLFSIIHSYISLNQKWKIQGSLLSQISEFDELLELLKDGLIDKNQIINLYLEPLTAGTEIVNSLMQADDLVFIEGKYSLLKEHKDAFSDIENNSLWIETLLAAETDVKELEEKKVFVVGEANASAGKQHFSLLNGQTTVESFSKKLLQLWTEGMEVCWIEADKDNRFNKVALPSTIFLGETFRLSRQNTLHQDEQDNRLKSNNVNAEISMKQQRQNVILKLEEQAMDRSEKVIVVENIEPGIAIIRMQDKTNRNMFSELLLSELARAFEDIENNDKIKAVILTGYENVFAMGGTQKQLTNIADRTSEFTHLSVIYKSALTCRVPVISAVQGHAMGGGFSLALYGDLIVMANEGIYTANYLNYGFTPGLGSTYIMKEKLGVTLSNEMIFTSGEYSGDALKLRGCSFIFTEQSNVLTEAIRLATSIAGKPSKAVRVLKSELSNRILKELMPIIENEVYMHAQVFESSEVQEVKERITSRFTKNNLKKDLKKEVDQRKDQAGNKVKVINSEFTSSTAIASDILNIISGVLQLPLAEIDRESEFEELGVDSISAIEIIRNVNKKFNLHIDTVSFYNYRSINLFIDFLEKEIGQSSASSNIAVRKIELRDTKSEYSSPPIISHNDKASGEIEVIEEQILQVISDVVDINLNKEYFDISFKEIGIDSINGVEIIRDLNKVLLTNLETIVLYEYSTVRALAQYIRQKAEPKNVYIPQSPSQIKLRDLKEQGERSALEEFKHEAPITLRNEKDNSEIESILMSLLSRILMITPDKIQAKTELSLLGLDSIGSVEFIRDINKHFKLNLETILVYEYTTVEAISDYISKQSSEDVREQKTVSFSYPEVVEQSRSYDKTLGNKQVLDLLRQLRNGEIGLEKVMELTGGLHERK